MAYTPESKASDRDTIAEAVARFQQSGGQIAALSIVPHREDKLRPSRHDKPADELAAIRKGKQDERSNKPIYSRSVRAYKAKLEEKA